MYTGMEIILTVQSRRIEFKTTIFFVMVLDIPPKYINLVLFLWQLSERARSLVSHILCSIFYQWFNGVCTLGSNAITIEWDVTENTDNAQNSQEDVGAKHTK